MKGMLAVVACLGISVGLAMPVAAAAPTKVEHYTATYVNVELLPCQGFTVRGTFAEDATVFEGPNDAFLGSLVVFQGTIRNSVTGLSGSLRERLRETVYPDASYRIRGLAYAVTVEGRGARHQQGDWRYNSAGDLISGRPIDLTPLCTLLG